MDLERLTALIDAYGSEPRRWPAHERQAALTLLATSAEAQAHLREAAALDALLAVKLPEIEPSASLKARVLAQTRPRPVATPGWRAQIAEALAQLFPRGQAMPQFAALALALAIGIGAGLSNVDLGSDGDMISYQLAAAANPVYFEE